MRFEIKDGERSEAFDKLVQKLEAGHTLPKTVPPVPEATKKLLDSLAKGDGDNERLH